MLGYVASDSPPIGLHADVVHCPRCRAEVPLLDERGAQCLYCLKGIPVPADALPPESSHGNLRSRLHTELDEVRDQAEKSHSAAWTFGLASVVFAGISAFTALIAFEKLGIEQQALQGTVLAGGLIIGGLTFALSVSWFFRNIWRSASIPYARLSATASEYTDEGALDAHCSKCGEGLSSRRTSQAVCKCCGTTNLMPAPLVPKKHRERYVFVLGRRLKTQSLGDAKAVAKTFSEEMLGWFLVFAGNAIALAWHVWATLPAAPEFLADPVGALVLPIFVAFVFAGFGAHSILSARRWRTNLTVGA